MRVGVQSHGPAALPRRRPGTHCIGGRVGPRAGLNGCGNSRRHCDSITRPSSRYTDWAIPAYINLYILLISWQTYHLHVPTVMKSGSLNLLANSGPLQACNRDCFTFTFTIYFNKYCRHWSSVFFEVSSKTCSIICTESECTVTRQVRMLIGSIWRGFCWL